MQKLRIACSLWLCLCGFVHGGQIYTNFLTPVCIRPFDDYKYVVCETIKFTVDGEVFSIPKNFETDLASIPRIAWSYMSPAHSSLMRASIVHDWFYRMTCDFTRYETDLIFYHMLRNDGVSFITANMMFYSVRLFGWNSYNEDYCDERTGTTGMDQEL
jgi:hypothetical protein